jgi:hypothetical protein
MKLTIDKEKKEIQVEGDITLGDLVVELEEMFPDGKWAEYRLATMVSYGIPILAPSPYDVFYTTL